MITRNWLKYIQELKTICTSCGLPVEVEIDSNPHGIDGLIEFGDIPLTREDSCVNEYDFNLLLIYSVPKTQYVKLIEKLMILTEKLTDDTRFIFTGWVKIDDESKLIYNGNIAFRGVVTNT